MSKTQNTITCPKCHTEIDVNDILHHQIEEDIKAKYRTALAKEKETYESQKTALQNERKQLEQQKHAQQQEIDRQVNASLKHKEQALTQALKAKLAEEQSAAMKSLQDEVNEKSSKLKELNQTKIQLEQLKREKEEMEDRIKAEAEQALNRKLKEEKERIQKDADDKNEMKVKELQKQLEDQKKLTEEMKRKQEQGSMQMQGEVQELAIEEWLAAQFPLDTIDEIKKGQRGADCLQTIHTRNQQNCGTIYYESKRTKAFQPAWVEKFKEDIREKGAHIGVLVTEVMPPDMDRMGLKDGIWICSFDEFKGLCTVLRESLIQLSSAMAAQENKGDKMSLLYDFLTSNEFKMQIESIVEGFTQMKIDLDAERRAMHKLWKKREKQIEKVLINTTDMVGSIKGIAGSAIDTTPLLELPTGDEDDDPE